MSQLVPCPACSRHVRVTEPTCPFCGDGLALAGTPAPGLPKSRLGRASDFAFGATLVGENDVGRLRRGRHDSWRQRRLDQRHRGRFDRSSGNSSSGAAGSSSGNAGDVNAAGSAGSGTVQDSGGVMALYGAAPAPDGGGIQPVYGAPAASERA